MARLAFAGNLSYDLIDGGPPRIGGAPIHCGRALRLLGTPATILRCSDGTSRSDPEMVFQHVILT